MEYKVGDKFQLRGGLSYRHASSGTTYVISATDPATETVSFVDDIGDTREVNIDIFVHFFYILILQVGDWVTCISRHPTDATFRDMTVGRPYQITHSDETWLGWVDDGGEVCVDYFDEVVERFQIITAKSQSATAKSQSDNPMREILHGMGLVVTDEQAQDALVVAYNYAKGKFR